MKYLASPYTHEDPAVMELRFIAACVATAGLIKDGINTISPIAHSHCVAKEGSVKGDWRFWKEYDEGLLRMCNGLYVLQINGWDSSPGVASEIDLAKRLGMEIIYLPATRYLP